MPGIRAVSFSIYGTLMSVPGGEPYFVHPEKFLMETALEKTIQEFKMWQSMSRKPGKPSEYMGRIYAQILDEVRIARGTAGERHPEVRADEIWERIVKRLVKNEYQYDQAFYGTERQLGEKISYFFHTALQGYAAAPRALEGLRALKAKGLVLGLLADAQCFTPVHLLRALARQGKLARVTEVFAEELIVLSFEVGARKPSERLYRALIAKLAERDIAPKQVLHVGSNLPNDLGPARRLGFHTALYAGDKASVVASNEQLNEPATRPDVLITEIGQLAEIVG
jgi:FMN phosphatase YigB (HAD superfamily)